jgi:hypothetical protein
MDEDSEIMIMIEFQPHRVQDGEGAGQSKSKNPGKIPHD